MNAKHAGGGKTGRALNWLKHAYFAPFRLIAAIVQVYRANRAWLEARLTRKHTALAVNGFILLTVLAWLVIWLAVDDDRRQRLNRAVTGFWQGVSGE